MPKFTQPKAITLQDSKQIKLRIMGSVKAGFPSPAEEELADTITLDDYLIDNKQASFVYKVSDEAMIDAGICPGDMMIVERGRQAVPGDIVIAEVDGEWIIRTLDRFRGRMILMAANPRFRPIHGSGEVFVVGVVVGIVRKYY